MANESIRRIALVGACGRMGQALTRRFSGAGYTILPIESSDHPAQGTDHGLACGLAPTGGAVTTIADPAVAACVAVVDFGAPESFRAALDRAVAVRIPFLSGTTGITAADHAALDAAATTIPVFHSANMSWGIAVLSEILPLLARLTGSMAVEIVETHHDRKKDAPSGTALQLGRIVARERGISLDEAAVHGRTGMPGVRKSGEIGFHAVRGGDVVGEHTILLFGDGERIELTHRAQSRELFAAGALRALEWLLKCTAPGRYDMSDLMREGT